jgi:hypothetical protein
VYLFCSSRECFGGLGYLRLFLIVIAAMAMDMAVAIAIGSELIVVSEVEEIG